MQQLTGVMPNSEPTDAEIAAAAVFLDAYGMKVTSLTNDYPINPGAYISKQEVLPHLIDFMADRGWEYSGAGFFAAVFVRGGLALKIGLKAGDTGAMYAAWCRANQALPGVPRIYSISKFSGCYLVLTRRYEVLRKEWLDDEDSEYLPALAEEHDAVRVAVNRGIAPGNARFDTVQTGLLIRDFFVGVVDFDVHEQNIMVDAEGNLIITDPVSYGPMSRYTGYSTYIGAYSSLTYYTLT